MAAQCLHEGETRAVLLRKQDAKQRATPSQKILFTKVTEYFSANFHLISTFAEAL